MKKLYFLLILFFLSPIIVKADLTASQQESIASFAKEFILEGNKRIGTDGFPIFAYMQGQARIDGYQGKMSYVSKDYSGINTVKAQKWCFDCSSFASFVYYHTFGLVLTTNTTKEVDPYSGLKLMNPTANPYLVSTFVSNADKDMHFYIVRKGISTSKLNFDELKKGDLLVFVGSHIMVYVGNGQIAHASSSAITRKNLGLEVVNLKDKYPDRTVRVLRLKDKIIPTNKVANMTVTWPDNGKTQILGKDDPPSITYVYKGMKDNKVTYSITMTDDFELKGYNITPDKKTPTKWINVEKGKGYVAEYEFISNGDYYVHAIDSRNQVSTKKITVNNIYVDDTSPVVEKVDYEYNINTNTFNVRVTATDESSISYSLDGTNYVDKNYFENLNRNTYTLYVKDLYNNITKQDIIISDALLPTIEVTTPSEYTYETTIKINATSTDGIKGYNLTRQKEKPEYFIQYTGEIYQKIIENGTYYIWISTKNGIINYKEIIIDKIDRTPPTISNVDISYNDNSTATIKVSASDDGCNNLIYSIDGLEYVTTSEFNNITSSKLTVFVKDGCNNLNIRNVNLDFPKPEIIEKKEKSSGGGTIFIILFLLIAAGVGGYFVYKKIKQ